MTVHCVWEHNGPDTLLYAIEYPGAFTRGPSLKEALGKMPDEIRSYCRWLNTDEPACIECTIVQEADCMLQVCDADSDVLFEAERMPLSLSEYKTLKAMALASAQSFQMLYDSVPDHHQSILKPRKTFYSQIPRTAQEMYEHTRNVNSYYFGEIGIETDHSGTILSCRERGFALLEKQNGYLSNPVIEGSYGEWWSLRKMMRRFIWHDRIHAKAMYRMAKRTFPHAVLADPFHFQ